MKPPPKSRYHDIPKRRAEDDLSELEEDEDEEDEEISDAASEHSQSSEENEDDSAGASDEEGTSDDASEKESDPEQSQSDHEDVLAKVRESVMNGEQERPNRKRKRTNKEEEVEDVYMRKLVREEIKDEERRLKKAKWRAKQGLGVQEGAPDMAGKDEGEKAEKGKGKAPTRRGRGA